MMDKSYKNKKTNWLQIFILCSFIKVYLLEKNYSVLFFNILYLILLEKNTTQKKIKQIYLHYLQFKNMRVTSCFNYIVPFRRQISHHST